MTSLFSFCERLGIDPEIARRELAARSGAAEAPWYMQAVLGVGAWITAIAALFFVGLVMNLVLDIDEPNAFIALVGIVLFGFSLNLLRRRPDGAFTGHMAVAFAVAGTLLTAAGAGFPAESVLVAALVTLPFAASAIWLQRSALLQFLITSVALILVMVAVWEQADRLVGDLAAITVPAGAALLLRPGRLNLRPTAFALLIVPQGVELLAMSFDQVWTWWYGWPARLVFLAVFGCLIVLNLRRVADQQRQMMAIAGAAAAIAVALLLPTGASVGLVLLALAYTLASRALAVIGALAEVYFTWQFYAELQSTLLTKSIILMGAGVVLLLCYGLLFVAARERRTA